LTQPYTARILLTWNEKTIHVRVDDEVLAWLQTETERQERTVSFLVGKILREAMGKKVGKA